MEYVPLGWHSPCLVITLTQHNPDNNNVEIELTLTLILTLMCR